MKIVCILLAIILSGCATDPPVEVKVPVAVSCITVAPQSPVVAPSNDLIALAEACQGGDERACYTFVTTVHVDRLNLIGYQMRAEAVMSGCVIR